MKKFLLSNIALACLCSFYATAQSNDNLLVDTLEDESDLEVITVVGKVSKFGATKSNIPVFDTPRSLSIITSDEFLNRGALTLDDTLSYTAGVVGDQFGFATRSDTTIVRGLLAPQYQDNLQAIFGFFNSARTDIYTLEQVEVLKGPASVLYGQASPGGAISVVSKKASANYLDKEIVLSAGTHNQYIAETDLGFELSKDGNWTARIVSIIQDSDTQIDFVEDDTFVFSPSITYSNDTTTITALYNYTKDRSDAAAQFLPLFGTACASSDVTITGTTLCDNSTGESVDPDLYVGDPNFNRFDATSESYSLFASHQINDIFSFDSTVRYRENEGDYHQTWVSFLGAGNARVAPDGTAFARSFFDSESGSEQLAFDLRLNADFNTGSITHQMIIGLSHQNVEQLSNDAFLVTSPTNFNIFNPVNDSVDTPTADSFDAVRFLSENETESQDIYLSDQITYGNLIVNAGIRFSSVESKDASSVQDDDENPISFGVLYKTDFGLNPYINYAESFLATVGTDIINDSPLLPQTGEQFEVGVKYQPLGSQSFVTLAYFDLEQENLVSFLAGGTTQEGDRAEITGVELEANIKVKDVKFELNITNLDADNIDADGVTTKFESLPDTTASLWVNWKPETGRFQGFSFGTGARYTSSNESNDGDIRIVTEGATVFDASVVYKAFESVDLSLNVRNLTNESYFTTCLTRGDCFVAEERTITARVAFKF